MLIPHVPPRAQLWTFTVVAIVASVLSVTAFDDQLHALTVGGRDLGFFMAEYERLLDVPVWHGLAAEPRGNDAFGFTGLDGLPTLHHDIHLSPLKYALALVRRVTGSWALVQLALVATVIAGLVYALVRFQRAAPGNTLTLLSLSALGLSPLFVHGTCHDLRPVVALSAFVASLAAALLTHAPSRHLVVIALLGLAVREEAAVVLALASFWLTLDGRRPEALRVLAIAAIYVIGFHAFYFGLSSFTYAPHAPIAAVWIAFALAPTLWCMPVGLVDRLARWHARHRAPTITILGAPFVAILMDPFFNGHLVRSALARAFPAVLVLVLATTYWLLVSASARVRRAAEAMVALSIVPALVSGVLVARSFREQALACAPVWSLASGLSSDTAVLTDFAHYQAFAGRDRLLVWERLPSSLEVPDGPSAPSSRPALLDVLRELDALWVMSPESYAELTLALARTGSPAAIERCPDTTDSGRFVVARPRAGRTVCPPR